MLKFFVVDPKDVLANDAANDGLGLFNNLLVSGAEANVDLAASGAVANLESFSGELMQWASDFPLYHGLANAYGPESPRDGNRGGRAGLDQKRQDLIDEHGPQLARRAGEHEQPTGGLSVAEWVGAQFEE